MQGPSYSNWRPQGSGDWLLIYTVAGAGCITVDDRPHELGVGHVVLFAPGAPQDYATSAEAGQWHLQWAHFHLKPEWRARLPGRTWGPGVHHQLVHSPEIRGQLGAAFRRMITTARQPWSGARELATNALEEALLWLAAEAGDAPHWQIDPRIRRAADYLANHPEVPFSLATVAGVAGLSASRFSHLFKSALGVSPQRYAEQIKFRLAQELLTHTNLPITEIAQATGFEDPLYFSKRFRHHAGASPSRFRLGHKSEGTDAGRTRPGAGAPDVSA